MECIVDLLSSFAVTFLLSERESEREERQGEEGVLKMVEEESFSVLFCI